MKANGGVFVMDTAYMYVIKQISLKPEELELAIYPFHLHLYVIQGFAVHTLP